MRLINKNFWSSLGLVFMIITLLNTITEIISNREITDIQLNILFTFVCCLIATMILSQYQRLDHFSPFAMLIIQYIIAIALVFFFVWLTSLWKPLHPNGYRDVFLSFSIPYLIASFFYYVKLRRATKKQNEDLQIIKKLSKEQKKPTNGM